MANIHSTLTLDAILRDQITGGMKAIEKATNNVDKGLKKVNQRASTFDMRMLSLLFGGMAIRRTFTMALKSIHNSFKKAEGNTSALTEATTKLSAGWEFLKFSIWNALDQSGVFRPVMDFLIKAVNWTSELMNKYPILGADIVTAFAVLATGGAVMMTIGQFKLLWDATFGVGGVLATKVAAGMGGEAMAAGTVTGAFSKGFMLMRKLAALGIGIHLFTSWLGRGEDYKLNIKDFVSDLGLATVAGYLGAGMYGALAGFSLALIIDVYSQRKRIKEATGEALRNEAGFFKGGAMSVATAVTNPFDYVRKMIDFFNNEATESTLFTFGLDAIKSWNKHIITSTEKTKDLDDAIYKHSLQPSMVLLNKEFLTNIGQTDLLNNKYPILTEQTNTQSSAVDSLASSYRELASSIEAVARARAEAESDENTNADGM